MKSSIKMSFLGSLVLVAVVFTGPTEAVAQPGMHISFQTFYDELAPHGRWINNPQYGYVWQPYAEPGFQPYATRGHWVVTEYGNTWVSDYDWGWAPFHYGRWFYDDFYGWAWVPGQEWGPSWVHWRHSNGYYGWAPLGPGMHINVSINIPVHHWVFVPHRYITHARIWNYYIPRRNVVNVYHQSVVVNNYYTTNNYNYVSGPSRRDIEKRTRSRVAVRTVEHDRRPGRSVVNNNSVRIYRPAVSESRATERPSRISAADSKIRSDRTPASRSDISRSSVRDSERTNSSYRPSSETRTRQSQNIGTNRNEKTIHRTQQRNRESNTNDSNSSYQRNTSRSSQENRSYSEQRIRRSEPASTREVQRQPQVQSRQEPPRSSSVQQRQSPTRQTATTNQSSRVRQPSSSSQVQRKSSPDRNSSSRR